MKSPLQSNPLYQLARRVTEIGPDDVAFDGLRVLQHPERFRKFLMGQELDIVPVTVQMWPSRSCDVRCPTCPYRLTYARDEAYRDDARHLMPFDLFKPLVLSLNMPEFKPRFDWRRRAAYASCHCVHGCRATVDWFELGAVHQRHHSELRNLQKSYFGLRPDSLE